MMNFSCTFQIIWELQRLPQRKIAQILYADKERLITLWLTSQMQNIIAKEDGTVAANALRNVWESKINYHKHSTK